MSKDQNIQMEFGEVRFNKQLNMYLEHCLRDGIPNFQQAAMMLVQDFVVAYHNAPNGQMVSYNANRSTYGKKQHLNVFEEFTMLLGDRPQFSISSEYADDPHHRISARHEHVKADSKVMAELRATLRTHVIDQGLQDVISKLDRFCNKFTTIKDGPVYGWWFNHEHGQSAICLDLTHLK